MATKKSDRWGGDKAKKRRSRDAAPVEVDEETGKKRMSQHLDQLDAITTKDGKRGGGDGDDVGEGSDAEPERTEEGGAMVLSVAQKEEMDRAARRAAFGLGPAPKKEIVSQRLAADEDPELEAAKAAEAGAKRAAQRKFINIDDTDAPDPVGPVDSVLGLDSKKEAAAFWASSKSEHSNHAMKSTDAWAEVSYFTFAIFLQCALSAQKRAANSVGGSGIT